MWPPGFDSQAVPARQPSISWEVLDFFSLHPDDADQAIAVHAVIAVRYCKARCRTLLDRTITNANSITAAREAVTAAGFAVLDLTVPGLELFAQPFGAPVE